MTDTPTLTMAERIVALGITMTVKPVDSNPAMDSDRDMDHWSCTLLRRETATNKGRMTVRFSMGIGHHGRPPEAADVLDCLCSDAAGVDNAGSFEDWCSEYGYDSDSRKALRTYKACKAQYDKLARFLGPVDLPLFLYYTEKL